MIERVVASVHDAPELVRRTLLVDTTLQHVLLRSPERGRQLLLQSCQIVGGLRTLRLGELVARPGAGERGILLLDRQEQGGGAALQLLVVLVDRVDPQVPEDVRDQRRNRARSRCSARR